MIKFNVLTLFPEMFTALTDFSIIKRAIDNELIEINLINFRDYSKDKHNKVDDYPYGGGSGMLLRADVLKDCLEDIKPKKLIYLSPKGRLFNQDLAKEYAKLDEITILCGHYEGLDERIIQNYVDEELSIGDYVLTGGELPAMVIIDTVSRLVDSVIKEDSYSDETHMSNFLEYPQYTRPYDLDGDKVPDVLLSGNHQDVDDFRLIESFKATVKNRIDLLDFAKLDKKEMKNLREILNKLKKED